jgi:hypothetical protein
MPSAESIERIDASWRQRLWCDEEQLASGSTLVRGFPADASHRFNVFASRRLGGGCIIGVHEHLLAPIEHFNGFPADETFRQELFTEAYAGRDIKFNIVAAQAYADATDLRDPGIGLEVRTIDDVGAPALERLHASAGDDDWAEAGMDVVTPPIFVTFVDGEIAGAARVIDRDGLRHVGVLTHPAQRGKAHSKAVAYAMAQHVTRHGEVLQWQARRSNRASLAVRDALGFIERYETITLRVE